MHRQCRLLWLAFVALAATAAHSQSASPPPGGMPQEVIAHIRGAIDDEVIAGCSVLIAVDNEVVVRAGFGYADIEAKRLFTPELLCPISSITKPITSLTMLCLAEQGVFTMDTPIATIATEFWKMELASGKRAKKPIRIRHLLSNTSGIPGQGYLTRDHMAFLNDPRASLAETAPRVARFPLVSEPGDAFEYSGAGFMVAGYVAERVARANFEDLMREKVLRPLGMARTTFLPNEFERRLAPRKYRTTDDGFLPFPGTYKGPYRLVDPSDGLFATIDDLARLGEYLLQPESYPAMLTADRLAEFDKKQSEGLSRTDVGYGLGVQRDREDEHGALRAFHHTGSGGQYFWVDRDRRVVGVFLTNANPREAVPVAETMREIVESYIPLVSPADNAETASD